MIKNRRNISKNQFIYRDNILYIIINSISLSNKTIILCREYINKFLEMMYVYDNFKYEIFENKLEAKNIYPEFFIWLKFMKELK